MFAVLPKFEVTLDMANYGLTTDVEVVGTIDAK